jgi:hypothetical protein
VTGCKCLSCGHLNGSFWVGKVCFCCGELLVDKRVGVRDFSKGLSF